MTTGTISASQKATDASEPEVTKLPTRTAKGGGSKQLRLTSRAKSPKKANGTATTTPKAQTKAKAQRKGGTPVVAKKDFTNDQVVTVKQPPEAGWLADRYQLLKTGQTVGEGLAGFKGLRRRRESMRKLIEGGFVTVK
jgi:hypothetical protein